MQKYTFSPESENEIDIKICNKKNEIQRLQEEIKLLELEKTKLNNEYIGRVFEMKDYGYVYVTGYSKLENVPFGIRFEDFEYSIEIHGGSEFDIENVEREISVKEFRSVFKHKLKWDKLKEIMEDN